MQRNTRLVVVGGSLAGFAFVLGLFQFVIKPAMIKGFITGAVQPATSVAVVEAKSTTWQPRIAAIGTFRAVMGVDIAPQVGGVVSTIQFQSGQDAAAGQPLLEIDTAVEQADLNSNVAALKNAEVSLERQRTLVQGGNTPKATYDLALAQRDQAAAAVEKSKSLIAQKKIVAPFGGRLGLRKIDAGQYVSPGTVIVTLQQLDPIFVDFPVPEQSLQKMAVGQTVEVTVDAFPSQTFKGVVKSLDARVSSDSRNIMVRSELPNPTKKLLPGMFANVSVVAGEPHEYITLPRTAVTYSLYGDSVYVVKPAPAAAGSSDAQTQAADQPLIAERRFVRTGDTRDSDVAVLEGVTAGEKVIGAGQIKLFPNAKVKIDANATVLPTGPRPKE